MRRHLILVAVAGLVAGPALAQQADRNDPRAIMRFGFGEVTGWIVRAAEMASQEQYAYKPVATVRSFGQLIGHLADSHNYYCGRASGQNVQWSDPIEKGTTDKAALIQALRRSIETCNSSYAGDAGRMDQLMANLNHDSLHYGNLVTYMRMLGLVPPSS